jgi:hypothetical protein
VKICARRAGLEHFGGLNELRCQKPHAIENLIQDETRRTALGRAAQTRIREKFSANVIVPRYETLYRRVCGRLKD